MNASKENARRAKRALATFSESKFPHIIQACKTIADFLDAAERKLPSEAAFEADKRRRQEKSFARS